MGASNSKTNPKKNLTIHIKKAVVKDNHIYLFDKDNIAQVIVEELIKIKKKESIDKRISSSISL